MQYFHAHMQLKNRSQYPDVKLLLIQFLLQTKLHMNINVLDSPSSANWTFEIEKLKIIIFKIWLKSLVIPSSLALPSEIKVK